MIKYKINKGKEKQNRFYSTLNDYDHNSLPSSEELNQKFISDLNSHKKCKVMILTDWKILIL